MQREEGGVLLGFANPTYVVGAAGPVDVRELGRQTPWERSRRSRRSPAGLYGR